MAAIPAAVSPVTLSKDSSISVPPLPMSCAYHVGHRTYGMWAGVAKTCASLSLKSHFNPWTASCHELLFEHWSIHEQCAHTSIAWLRKGQFAYKNDLFLGPRVNYPFKVHKLTLSTSRLKNSKRTDVDWWCDVACKANRAVSILCARQALQEEERKLLAIEGLTEPLRAKASHFAKEVLAGFEAKCILKSWRDFKFRNYESLWASKNYLEARNETLSYYIIPFHDFSWWEQVHVRKVLLCSKDIVAMRAAIVEAEAAGLTDDDLAEIKCLGEGSKVWFVVWRKLCFKTGMATGFPWLIYTTTKDNAGRWRAKGRCSCLGFFGHTKYMPLLESLLGILTECMQNTLV